MDAHAWLEEFESAFARIAGRFARVEPRRQARAFLFGLLSDVDTRSCWQVAVYVADAGPGGSTLIDREVSASSAPTRPAA